MHNRTPCAVLLAASAILPSTLFAADDGVTVAPVTVTATRSAQTANESLASVSVITRDEIERSAAGSMTELLGREPGVELTRSGGRGTLANIHLRGTESDHVLVLVDGVEVGSATTGTATFEDLPLANVERVEIVRGPRSSLYGSRAIGGVIQIFTRDGAGAHASIGSGSNDRRKGSAGYGFRNGDTSMNIHFSAEETDGIDARANNYVRNGVACGSAFVSDCDEPDDDGYENQSINLSASHAVTDAVTLSARALATDSESEFDGSAQNRTKIEQRIYSGRIDAQLTRNWSSRIQVSRAQEDTDNFLDREKLDRFNTRRDAANWHNEVTIGASQVISAGIDTTSVEIDSNLDFDEDSRDTTGLYAQHQWIGAAWSTEASLRSEDYDEFDDPVTGSLAVGYRISPEIQAFTSYGTAFRAPTFNELYYPGFANPDLEPEESRTFEVGLRGRSGALQWQTTAYHTEVDQLIANFSGSNFFDQPKNVDEARITGIEILVGVDTRAWDGQVALDLKDTENTDTGAELPRRAQIGLQGSMTRKLGAWSLGADASVQGERFDDTENNTPLDAYGLIDLRASWSFAPDWAARFKVANATDTDYALADTYNTLGRTWLVELAWRPGSD